MIDDITRNKHGGNQESEEANAKIHKTKETVRREVYEFIQGKERFGATADEVAEAFDCTHNHVAPRISELRRDRKLFPSEFRRKTRSGASARVLVTDTVMRKFQMRAAGPGKPVQLSLRGGA